MYLSSFPQARTAAQQTQNKPTRFSVWHGDAAYSRASAYPISLSCAVWLAFSRNIPCEISRAMYIHSHKSGTWQWHSQTFYVAYGFQVLRAIVSHTSRSPKTARRPTKRELRAHMYNNASQPSTVCMYSRSFKLMRGREYRARVQRLLYIHGAPRIIATKLSVMRTSSTTPFTRRFCTGRIIQSVYIARLLRERIYSSAIRAVGKSTKNFGGNWKCIGLRRSS